MSNSTIYAIDPTLVTERHRSYGASGRAGPYEALQRDPFDRRALRFDNRRQSLRLAARETGGLAYTFTTKVAEALDEIQRDAGRYYLLSYTPDVINKDGAYHELEVKVLRDDVRVRARAGYVDLSPEQRAEMQEAADRFFPWRVTGRRAP